MDIKVFERDKEDGRLVFKALNFEVMMHDLIETMSPESKKELEFMIMQMVDSIQTVASEHYKDNFDNQDEWEDIYYR
jgi:hypothetical protein